jgi:hypothetical protein
MKSPRKQFWDKIEKIWLRGEKADIETVAKMICTVTKHNVTKRDIATVKKFIQEK